MKTRRWFFKAASALGLGALFGPIPSHAELGDGASLASSSHPEWNYSTPEAALAGAQKIIESFHLHIDAMSAVKAWYDAVMLMAENNQWGTLVWRKEAELEWYNDGFQTWPKVYSRLTFIPRGYHPSTHSKAEIST